MNLRHGRELWQRFFPVCMGGFSRISRLSPRKLLMLRHFLLSTEEEVKAPVA